MAIQNIMKIELSTRNIDDSSKQYVADLILPASTYEIDDAIEKCRSYLEKTDEIQFTISTCESVPQLCNIRLESATLQELNYLAKRISKCADNYLAAYKAFLPLVIGENYTYELINIKDLINLTYSVGKYPIISGVSDIKDIGDMAVENGMFKLPADMPNELYKYLDYELIGAEQKKNDNGLLCDGHYIVASGFELENKYDGETIPEALIDKYLFRFSLTTDSEKNCYIDIPFSKDVEKFFQTTKAVKFNVWDFESAIPQISGYSNKMHSRISVDELNRINDFAKNYISANTVQRIIFKAALYSEDITNLDNMDNIEWLFNNTESYDLNPLNIFPADFAMDYLEQHLDDSFPKEYLKTINTQLLGDKLMNDYRGAYTPYGVLLKNSNTPILMNDSKHDFMLANFLDEYVLFTEDRLKPQEIPKGLYKYEFRSGAEYRYAALEEKVGVDFSGTILSKVPFDLGEKQYIDLEEENGVDPDILSEEYTLNQYLSSDFETEENVAQTEVEGQTGGMQM